MNNEHFMFRVLEMYYTEELSQAEIAKRMQVSRATISRTIYKAKQEGYVTIQIHYPKDSQCRLEEKLEKRYGLNEVIIAPVSEGEDVRRKVNEEIIQYLLRVLKNNMTISITWGKTIGSMIEQLKKDTRLSSLNVKGIQIVPFTGTAMLRNPERSFQDTHANIHAIEMAGALNGAGYQLPVPMYVSSVETKQVLEEDPNIRSVIEIAEKADLGMVPIGQLTKEASIVKSGILPEEEMEALVSQGAAGEILGNFFDIDGNPIDAAFTEHIIAIKKEQFLKIPNRIGIAYGEDRIKATIGALNSGMINVLFTDSKTAEQLVGEDSNGTE